jgi:hypothetical protein
LGRALDIRDSHPARINLTGDHVREVTTPHSRDSPDCGVIMLDSVDMGKGPSKFGYYSAGGLPPPTSRCFNAGRAL